MSASKFEIIPFHGAHLEAVRDEHGIWAPLLSMCGAIGADFSGQLKKLKSKGWATMAKLATVAADGKVREVVCLHVDCIPMWLACISPGRCSPDKRGMLDLLQKEATQVLRDHFLGKPGTPVKASKGSTLDVMRGMLDEIERVDARTTALEIQTAAKAERTDLAIVAARVETVAAQRPKRLVPSTVTLRVMKGNFHTDIRAMVSARCAGMAPQAWITEISSRYQELNRFLGTKSKDGWGIDHCLRAIIYMESQWSWPARWTRASVTSEVDASQLTIEAGVQ